MKQIEIQIFPNGEIKAETKGIKGKVCLKYLLEVERMANAVTTDSKFTDEYLETANEYENNMDIEQKENA